jgi:hypothetical protein
MSHNPMDRHGPVPGIALSVSRTHSVDDKLIGD